ncbi:MAG: hypothetical protein AAF823_07605 [Planctomycetota bacterium]
MSGTRPADTSVQAAKLAILVVAWLGVGADLQGGAAAVVSAAMSAHSQSVAWAQSIRRSTPTAASHVVRPRLTLARSIAADPRPVFDARFADDRAPALPAHLLNLPPPSA